MTARAIWGDRGDGNGVAFWVPKSGFDAFSAAGEQLLIAKDTYIFQPLQAGLVELPYPGGIFSAARSANVALNAFAANLSRIVVWANVWVQQNESYPPNPGGMVAYDDAVSATAGFGNLTISAANVPPGNFYGTGPNDQSFYPDRCWASWVLFRARY